MRYDLARVLLTLAAVGIFSGAAARAQDNILRKAIMGEVASNGVDHSAQVLDAGPVRLKLQDGELRYLRVGDKEIVRRIYFAVRNGNWDTAMPRFTQVKVDKAADHFAVQLAAECKMGAVEYSWTAKITGAPDGKISFVAEGTPGADFDSNRIGLCVLFGTPSLAGQGFETDGTTPARGTFPKLVSAKHVADQFHTLSYEAPNGLRVSVNSDGAIFDMEDQRNWGDSSWKAFAPLPYAYKHVAKGDTKKQTITVSVSGLNAGNRQAAPQEPVTVEIGVPAEGKRLPSLATAALSEKTIDFTAISFKRDAFKDKKRIDWSYAPTTHLPDNDTIMENLPAIADQANTIREINPTAELHAGPLRLSAKSEDPRSKEPIAAAWALGAMKYLAAGGVTDAYFDLKGEIPTAALDAIRPYAQHQMLDVETSPRNSTRVLALGCIDQRARVVFIINTTPRPTRAHLGFYTGAAKVLHVTPGGKETATEQPKSGIQLDLGPYDVYRVTYAREKR